MKSEFPRLARSVPKWVWPSPACAGALALLFASDVRADVIAIDASGAVTRTSGPTTVIGSAVSPIETPAPTRPRATSAELAPRMAAAGDTVALSPALIEAVAWTESRFNQSARSPAGAVGIMQLMPGTAEALGVDATRTDDNLRGGATYLRQMLSEFDGDVVLALAAYNAGPAAVRRYGGVPPYRETQTYVATVLGYLADKAAEETEQ